jgi:polar amino acid transport system substrate-binding protein
MEMKKILTIFMVAFALLTVTACATTTTNTTTTDDSNSSTTTTNTTTTTQAPLRVGMDLRYPPFETVNFSNEPEGISVDIALALGEYIGREVEIVNTNFASIIPALNAGDIDIAIASMSITDERSLVVDFTDPYFYFKIISLVNKDFAVANSITEDSTVQDLLAIQNANYVGLASQVSTTIPESYGKTVIEATDLGTAIENVAQGTSDILLIWLKKT